MTTGKLQFCQNDWNLLKGKDRKDETEVEVQGTTRIFYLKLSRDADLHSLQRSSTAKAKSRHLWNVQDISFSMHSSEPIRQSYLWEERSGIMQFTAQGPSEPFGSQGFWSIKYEREYSDAKKVNLQAEQKVNRGFCTEIECILYVCLCNQDINVTLRRVNTHTY